VPRDEAVSYSEFQYHFAGAKLYLPRPTISMGRSFIEVLEGRRSRRLFGRLSAQRLSLLLWYAARTRASHQESSGFLWQHRPAPSAGGRHPVDILVAGQRETALYDPISHSLHPLHNGDLIADGLVSLTNEVVPVQQATILWFVAQPARTASKYANAESLIWRDAGALLTVISLVAEALDLNCCAIGATGDPWLSGALEFGEDLHGLGGCLVGEAPNQSPLLEVSTGAAEAKVPGLVL
jgi:SagB-type dehydrogenase family enzyme